jgi:hypothetical protein
MGLQMLEDSVFLQMALQISATPGVNLFVTSDNKALPMTMTGVTGELASATNDSFVDDNSGTYTLRIKKG